MKYKICQLQDANGDMWYQVKIKGLLFWYWAYDSEYYPGGIFRLTKKFSSEQSAREYIRDDIRYHNKGKTKIVKCMDV